MRIVVRAEDAKDGEARQVPFQPGGRLESVLNKRRFLGPNAFTFGAPDGSFAGEFRTAWESLVLLAHDVNPERLKPGARVDREAFKKIDLHWHDLRHECACRWWEREVDLRSIQLLLGHSSIATTERYLNITGAEVQRVLRQKVWGEDESGRQQAAV